MPETKLMEKYLEQRGFRRATGFAINTKEMNPEDFDEIILEGETLEGAAGEYFREIDFWIYDPSDGAQVFEDITEAVDYAEDESDVSFDDFKKSETERQ